MADPLKQAKEIADNILNMTKAVIITGFDDVQEAEVEAYANLMEKREPLVQQLAELKKEIDAAMASSPEFEEIQQTISRIAEIDNANLTYVERMSEDMKVAMRKIKGGQKVYQGYGNAPLDTESHMFDTKQ